MGTTDLLLRRLEKELRPIARERIAKGQMPREAPTRFWGGFGTGRLCALCDKPIEAAVQTLWFHRVCHYAWQLECVRVKRKPRGVLKNPQ